MGTFSLPLPKLEFLKTKFSVHPPHPTPAPCTIPSSSKGMVLKEQMNERTSPSKHKYQQQNGPLSLSVGLLKNAASGTQTEDLRDISKWGSQESGQHRDGKSVGNMKYHITHGLTVNYQVATKSRCILKREPALQGMLNKNHSTHYCFTAILPGYSSKYPTSEGGPGNGGLEVVPPRPTR